MNHFEVTRNMALRDLAWINDISFDHKDGSLLASVGDDRKLILWKQLDTSVAPSVEEIRLGSNGVRVKFHKDLENHLLVGELSGRVGIFDIDKSAWLFSVYTNDLTLKSIDWNQNDANIIGAITNSVLKDLFITVEMDDL